MCDHLEVAYRLDDLVANVIATALAPDVGKHIDLAAPAFPPIHPHDAPLMQPSIGTVAVLHPGLPHTDQRQSKGARQQHADAADQGAAV